MRLIFPSITFHYIGVYDSVRFALDADFGAIFGAEIDTTIMEEFLAAVNLTFVSFGVETAGIMSMSALPGSIIVDITATTATIDQINIVLASGLFYLTFGTQIYNLVNPRTGSGPSSSGSCVTMCFHILRFYPHSPHGRCINHWHCCRYCFCSCRSLYRYHNCHLHTSQKRPSR